MPLNEDQISFFHRNGYLILENYFADQRCKLVEEAEALRKTQSQCVAQSIVSSSGCIVEPVPFASFAKDCTATSVLCGSKRKMEETSVDCTDHTTYISLRQRRPGNTAEISSFVTSSIWCSLLKNLLGGSVFLLNEQYIIKPGRSEETYFSYHQDSEYMHDECKHMPYISCWIALDDMNEENGTLYIVPYPQSAERARVLSLTASPSDISEHHCACASHYLDKEYYKENSEELIDEGEEIPVLVSAGSVVLLSWKVLHSSSANLSDKVRRAYMPQYSGLAVPAELGHCFSVQLREATKTRGE